MTDSEKLDLLLQKAISTENEVRSLRNDVDELKQDMNKVKSDIIYLKSDNEHFKSNIISLQTYISEIKVDLKESHRYSDIILDEVERVHDILDQHKIDKSIHTA